MHHQEEWLQEGEIWQVYYKDLPSFALDCVAYALLM